MVKDFILLSGPKVCCLCLMSQESKLKSGSIQKYVHAASKRKKGDMFISFLDEMNMGLNAEKTAQNLQAKQ